MKNEIQLEDLLDEINLSAEAVNQIQLPLVKSKNRRFKRFDMRMSEGCSAHETGLAVAFYSIYFEQGLLGLE